MLHAEITELVADAFKSRRLSRWERDFMHTMAYNLTTYGKHFQPSPREITKMREISQKVYAVG